MGPRWSSACLGLQGQVQSLKRGLWAKIQDKSLTSVRNQAESQSDNQPSMVEAGESWSSVEKCSGCSDLRASPPDNRPTTSH